jgi:hypothetical protein
MKQSLIKSNIIKHNFSSEKIIQFFLLSILTLLLSSSFENSFLMGLGALLSGVIGLCLLIRQFIYIDTFFRFTDVLASFTLLSVGFGTYIPYISNEWQNALEGIGILNNQVSSVANALIYVNIYSFTFFVLNLIFTKKNNNLHTPETPDSLLIKKAFEKQTDKDLSQLLTSCFFISIYQFYLIKSGKFGFLWQGTVDRIGNGSIKLVKPEMAIILLLVSFVFFVLGLSLLGIGRITKKNTQKILVFFYLFSLFIQIIWLLIAATRGEFIFNAFLFIFGFTLSNIYFHSHKKNNFNLHLKVKKLIIIGLVILSIVYTGIQVTSFIRFLNNKVSNFKELGLEERVNVVYNEISNYYIGRNSLFQKEEFESKLRDNFSTRTFVITGLIIMMENKQYYPLGGEEFINNLRKSVPRIIGTDKFSVLTQEALYFTRFNMTSTGDLADSFYLSSYVDFSIFGSILYPLIIFTTLNLYVKFLCKLNISRINLLVIIALFFNVSIHSGEIALSVFFLLIRDTLMFIAIFEILYFFIGSKKKME